MALALSMYNIGVFFWRRHETFLIAGASAPSLAAIISASVVERAIVFCNRLVQDTAPSANIAIRPVVERLVAVSSAKSASLKTFISPEPPVYPIT